MAQKLALAAITRPGKNGGNFEEKKVKNDIRLLKSVKASD